MKPYTLVCLCIVSLFGFFACQNEDKQVHPRRKVIVTAHRGASGLAPENTMAAMSKAMEIGAEYAELDVQEIADGSLILFHDKTLNRSTNSTGNIWEMRLEDLQGVDAGSWYDEKYRGEPIPTLEAVIDSVYGKMKLNIELKMNGHEKQLVERVVELVREKNFVDECVITSFDREAVRKVKQLNPKITTGFIFSEMPNENVLTGEFGLLSMKKTLVTEDFINKAHKVNKKVHVWTINERDEMSQFISMGVDGIITDRPDVLIELLKEMANSSNSKEAF